MTNVPLDENIFNLVVPLVSPEMKGKHTLVKDNEVIDNKEEAICALHCLFDGQSFHLGSFLM